MLTGLTCKYPYSTAQSYKFLLASPFLEHTPLITQVFWTILIRLCHLFPENILADTIWKALSWRKRHFVTENVLKATCTSFYVWFWHLSSSLLEPNAGQAQAQGVSDQQSLLLAVTPHGYTLLEPRQLGFHHSSPGWLPSSLRSKPWCPHSLPPHSLHRWWKEQHLLMLPRTVLRTRRDQLITSTSTCTRMEPWAHSPHNEQNAQHLVSTVKALADVNYGIEVWGPGDGKGAVGSCRHVLQLCVSTARLAFLSPMSFIHSFIWRKSLPL